MHQVVHDQVPADAVSTEKQSRGRCFEGNAKSIYIKYIITNCSFNHD